MEPAPAPSYFDQHFTPRAYQRDPLQALTGGGYQRGVLVWHRGAGKDKASWVLIGDRALNGRVGDYFYWFPTYSEAQRALWNNVDGDGFRTLEHVPPAALRRQVNTKGEALLELKNGSTIEVLAGDEPRHINRARGVNPAGVVFSEAAFTNPYAWEVMRPRCELNGAWVLFNSTP